MILEALRDVTFWRRNFHPEDDILITEKVRRGEAFQDSLALLQQEFLCLLANLKGDIPFYSPRYIGLSRRSVAAGNRRLLCCDAS
ncbi:MAG: hypothetical protein IPJ07_25560 [Acidobacteria bacterium]|nr:hypothetical protein [Acidobacteriota bacterium]